MSAPMVPRAARVRAVTRELDDVVTIELDAVPGFAFAPGQFHMLYVDAIGEVAISISGDAPGAVLHTVRAVGSVTKPLARVREGDVLGVRGPYGAPWPLDEARGKDVLVIAGGLGLAPLRAAILRVLADRSAFGRLLILYGARSPEGVLYREELDALRGREGVDLQLTVDRADLSWRGHVGVVPDLVARARFDPGNAIAMICGPELMMRYTVRALEARGVPHAATWVSMERNMKCAIGHCGHCQLGPVFVCKDGPVFRLDRIAPWFWLEEA